MGKGIAACVQGLASLKVRPMFMIGIAGALLFAAVSGSPSARAQSASPDLALSEPSSGTESIGWLISNLEPTRLGTILARFDVGSGAPDVVAVPDVRACSTIPIERLVPEGSFFDRRPDIAWGLDDDSEAVAIGGVVRSDWFSSGRATFAGLGQPSEDLVVPLLLSDFYGQCSRVVVRNPSDTAVSFRVDAYRNGDSTPAWSEVVTEAGAVPAFGTWTFNACSEAYPGMDTFIGSMRITSDQPLTAWATVFIEDSPATYAFEAQPVEAAAEVLFAPLIRRRQMGLYDTAISVVNPNADPVDVTVTYYGQGGTCVDKVIVHGGGPKTIVGHSSEVFGQSFFDRENGLPDGCLGSATISSEGGGVLAIVNDTKNFTREAAAYNAISRADGSEVILLPLARDRHIDGFELTTGFQVMNIGSEVTTVTVTYVNHDGSLRGGCSGCIGSIPPMKSLNILPGGAVMGFPNPNWYGSAILKSDGQPIVAVVNDFSYTGAMDFATYNGLPCRSGGASRVGLP